MMIKIIARTISGEIIEGLESPFSIGDHVRVVDGGKQYSTYYEAFIYFWGNKERYYLPWEGQNKDEIGEMPKTWKIINMAVHEVGNIIIYHIRSRDGKNCVVNGKGIELTNSHNRNRALFDCLEIYKLPLNGRVTPHEWTEKLYKIR